MDIGEAKKLSLITFFTGIKSACASLCRALAVPMPETESQLVDNMLAQGWALHFVEEITKDLITYTGFVQAGGSEHLLTTLSDLLSNTWAFFENLNGCINPTGGANARHK